MEASSLEKVENKRKCLQSRNILSLMSYAEGSKQHSYLKKHIDECQQCAALYDKNQRNDELLDIAIPVKQISSEVRDELQREVREMITHFDLNNPHDVKVKSKKVWQKIKAVFSFVWKMSN